MQRVTMTSGLFITAITVALVACPHLFERPTRTPWRREWRFTPRRSARRAIPSRGRAARRIRSTASARSSRPTTSAQWITKPAEMTAKTKSTKKPPMPAKYGTLPAADVDALVAYMQSLK